MPPKVMQCGPKCRSREHAYELNVAISKGTLHEVQSYTALCYNGAQMNDVQGRSALHVAASCGKVDVLEWLLEEKSGDVTVKDVESGWTALHRAMFYGQIAAARLLIQYKSDVYTRDHEGLGPLDIAMKDRTAIKSVPPPVYQLQDRHEVYTWGDNSNFTLGHATEHRRSNPEVVDELRKQNITIKQVVMCKYHTVFVTSAGRVYTCGHGLGGRLGHATEETCLVPRLVEALANEVVVEVAAARDHTVFRTDSGAIFTCGMNNHHQLGQQPVPETSPLPRPVSNKRVNTRVVTGVCAGRFHTVLYTTDAVFTCGLNAGQMGHLKPKGDRKVTQLRQVSALNKKNLGIVMVRCSDAATVVFTKFGEIYVLHEYQCRTLASNRSDIIDLCVVGGCLDHSDSQILRENGGKELIICYLNMSGKVFIWRDCSTSFKRAHWMIKRLLYVTNFVLTEAGLAVVTDAGEVFVGYIPSKPPPVRETGHATKESVSGTFGQMSLMDLLMLEEIEEVQVRRIPSVHRATYIMADRKGHNYTVVQSSPNCNLTDVPAVSKSTISDDFGRLLEESDEYDLIHDLIIQIHDQIWPVHTFILVNRCTNVLGLLTETAKSKNDMDIPVVHIQDIHPQILEQLLLYIYTDTCDLLTVGSKFELDEHHTTHHAEEVFHMELDEEIDTKSNKKMSAYQAHKKSGGKENGADEAVMQNMLNQQNPIKLLQEVGKKWGVKRLAAKLDRVKFHKGRVLRNNKNMARSSLQFYREKLRDMKPLYDVSIMSEDGVEYRCHKCVLVARLEYFHSMLASGWMETTSSSALTLPIPADILEILLEYLYMDDSTVVQSTQNVELLCNILVVADQMLVTRLKEMCEAAVATLLTLRNVGEVLEFASMYNAGQLRTTCQQYIVINLPAMLEARYLEVLSDPVMDNLIKYYRNSIDNMSRRIITPYDDFPDKAYLEALAAEDIDLSLPVGFTPEPKKPKTKKKRNRTKSSSEDYQDREKGIVVGRRHAERQLSVSSDVSVKSDEENTEPQSPSLTIDCSVEEKVVSPVDNEPAGPWGRMKSPVSPVSPPVTPQRSSGPGGPSLRDIMAQEKSEVKADKTPGGQKSGKFSWKQEKKKKQQHQQQRDTVRNRADVRDKGVVLTQRDTNNHVNEEKSPSLDKGTASNPWGSFTKVVQSFRNLMVEEETATVVKPGPGGDSRAGTSTVNRPGPDGDSRTGTSTVNKPGPGGDNKAGTSRQGRGKTTGSSGNSSSILSWGLPKSGITIPKPSQQQSGKTVGDSSVSPRSLDNPWMAPGLAQSPTSPTCSFSEIIRDEQQKTDVLVKNINKPLSLIQIEEQAIQDLLKHYNAEGNVDERITVERVPQVAAIPFWKRERLTSNSLI